MLVEIDQIKMLQEISINLKAAIIPGINSKEISFKEKTNFKGKINFKERITNGKEKTKILTITKINLKEKRRKNLLHLKVNLK